MSTSFTENILLRVVIHVMSVGVGLVGLLVEYWCTYFGDFLWCIDINTSTKHWEPVYMVATSVNGFLHKFCE